MVAFLAIATSALLALPSVLAEPSISLANIFARQFTGFDPSQIPADCLNNQCTTAYVAASSCLTGSCVNLDCLCTTAVIGSAKDCFQCIVDAQVPGFTQTIADDTINGFLSGCAAIGHAVV